MLPQIVGLILFLLVNKHTRIRKTHTHTLTHYKPINPLNIMYIFAVLWDKTYSSSLEKGCRTRYVGFSKQITVLVFKGFIKVVGTLLKSRRVLPKSLCDDLREILVCQTMIMGHWAYLILY